MFQIPVVISWYKISKSRKHTLIFGYGLFTYQKLKNGAKTDLHFFPLFFCGIWHFFSKKKNCLDGFALLSLKHYFQHMITSDV